MYSPHKFSERVGSIGEPLPELYRTFGMAKAVFRRGATSMIAGTPGSFKSVLGLNMAAMWAEKDVRSLYFCADSDEATVVTRLSGIITGENFSSIERRIIAGERDRYAAVLGALRMRTEFEYERMIGIEEIALHVKSYEAVYGGYPDVIFLDNLIDYVSSYLAFEEMQELIGELDSLAKMTSSHVCILHHAKLKDDFSHKKDETRGRGWPPADWEVAGKLTQKPRMVLTIAAQNAAVKMSVIKNSLGPQTPDASVSYDFAVFDSMRMRDRYGTA